MDKPIDVFCPRCRHYGRAKLLLQKEAGSNGIIHIRCRGCKEIIKIDLSEEPVSRLSK